MRAFFVLGLSGAVTVFAVGALAGEPRRAIDVSRALDAGAPAPLITVIAPIPPDPPPLVVRAQWVLDLRWDRGAIWLLEARRTDLPSAQPTPRVMGRFALELFEGRALIERVRFDFPMLGAPESLDAGFSDAPSLTQKLRTRVGVLFPATERGTRLELWDRATGRRWALPWPPSASSPSDASDAGSAARPGPAPSGS